MLDYGSVLTKCYADDVQCGDDSHCIFFVVVTSIINALF